MAIIKGRQPKSQKETPSRVLYAVSARKKMDEEEGRSAGDGRMAQSSKFSEVYGCNAVRGLASCRKQVSLEMQ